MDRLLVDLFDVEIDTDTVACPGEISDAEEDRETQQHLNDARWWWEGFWRTSLSNMLSCVQIVHWCSLAEKDGGISCNFMRHIPFALLVFLGSSRHDHPWQSRAKVRMWSPDTDRSEMRNLCSMLVVVLLVENWLKSTCWSVNELRLDRKSTIEELQDKLHFVPWFDLYLGDWRNVFFI